MGPLAILLIVLGLATPISTPTAAAPTAAAPDVPAATAVQAPTAVPFEAAPHGVWPLQPRPAVVQGFNPPANPYGRGHRGVDLQGRVGQQVHTALAGTVTFAGLLAGTGVVVVDHGTTRTTYQPVAASVPVGAPVSQGAVIGTLLPSGSHCPPAACLHWGWIRNAGPAGPEVYLDPLLLVGAVPMRLLPLPSSR